jgi:hypothetical protein
VWLMVAAGAGWAEFLAAQAIRSSAPDATPSPAQGWVYLLVYLTVAAAAMTAAVAATGPGARMPRLVLVVVGAVGASLAADELLPATREALVTAYTLRPLPGSEPWLLTAQALLGSGVTWLGLACAVALCVVSRSRPVLAVTLAGGAFLLPLVGRVAIGRIAAVAPAPHLAVLAGATAAVVVWQVVMEIRVATRAGGGLGRLLATSPIVVLVVLAAKLAWLWAGYRQALPRAFGGGPQHWAAARVDGPVAWLVAFLVAATAVFLLVRVQQAGLRLRERAVTRIALLAGAVLVLPSLLRLTLQVAGTVVGGLRPVRGAELAPLAAALVLAGWFARTRRSRTAIVVAALVGCCALVAASALLLGPAPDVERGFWEPPFPSDPRWVLVARLGLAAALLVLSLAGLGLGWTQLSRSIPPPSGRLDAAAAPKDALINTLAIVGFFLWAALSAGMAVLTLVSPGLVRQSSRVVWDLVIGAAPEPVSVDSALTVTAATVVVVQVLRRRTAVPAVLTGVVVGSTLLVHALPFGLRALQDTPRLLLLGPALAFAFLLLFDAGSLNRAGPSRQWRTLAVTATLAFLLALVGLGVAERRIQSPASLIPDDPYPRLLTEVGGVDVLRLFLGLPLLVVFTAACNSRSGRTLASERPSQHSTMRAVLGLATVAVLLAALMTWSRARDPSCGTVRTIIGTPVEVVPSAGAVGCAEATQVLRAYYGRVWTEGQGSGGFLTVGRWECSSESPAGVAETGQVTTCTDGARRIVSLAR